NEVNITGQDPQDMQVVLDINRNGATLQGQVLNADTSEPLASVRIIGAIDTEAARTDTDGRFEIKHLPIGTSPEYTINADGYLRETLKIEKVESDSTITKTILLGKGKGSMEGRIMQEDGSPAVNLNVQYVRYPSEKDPMV